MPHDAFSHHHPRGSFVGRFFEPMRTGPAFRANTNLVCRGLPFSLLKSFGPGGQRSWALPFAVLLSLAGVIAFGRSRTHLPFVPRSRTQPELTFSRRVARSDHRLAGRSFSAWAMRCRATRQRAAAPGLWPRKAAVPARSSVPSCSTGERQRSHRPGLPWVLTFPLSGVRTFAHRAADFRARQVSRSWRGLSRSIKRRRECAALAEARRVCGRSCRAARWLFNPGRQWVRVQGDMPDRRGELVDSPLYDQQRPGRHL